MLCPSEVVTASTISSASSVSWTSSTDDTLFHLTRFECKDFREVSSSLDSCSSLLDARTTTGFFGLFGGDRFDLEGCGHLPPIEEPVCRTFSVGTRTRLDLQDTMARTAVGVGCRGIFFGYMSM